MFERFTDRARRVVVLAQEEARLLNHDYIGTEHILLGLIQEGEGVAAKVLQELGISGDAVRAQVESIIGVGEGAAAGHIPFTPRSKKLLELSLREALQLGHNYIGTEHILLGLLREGEGVAAQILVALGVDDLSTVRQAVIGRLSAMGPGRGRPGPGAPSPSFLPGPKLTPALAKAHVSARFLAKGSAIGTQHQLQALLADESSMATKALAALGVTKEAVEQQLAGMDPAGTSDETPEEAGARRIRMRVEGKLLTLEVDDPELAASLEQAMAGRKARIISGTDPEATDFPNLWTAVSRTVDDLTRRLSRVATARGSRRSGGSAEVSAEWRPPGWHGEGHAAVYWMASTAGGGSGHLELAPGTDAAAVRAWLRDWLATNEPKLAGHANERAARHCALWAFVDRTGDSFTMTSFGFGVDGPPGCQPVALDVLIEHALADLA